MNNITFDVNSDIPFGEVIAEAFDEVKLQVKVITNIIHNLPYGYYFKKLIQGSSILEHAYDASKGAFVFDMHKTSPSKINTSCKALDTIGITTDSPISPSPYIIIRLNFLNPGLYDLDEDKVKAKIFEEDKELTIYYKDSTIVAKPSDPIYYIATQYMLSTESSLSKLIIREIAYQYADILIHKHALMFQDCVYMDIDKQTLEDFVQYVYR